MPRCSDVLMGKRDAKPYEPINKIDAFFDTKLGIFVAIVILTLSACLAGTMDKANYEQTQFESK